MKLYKEKPVLTSHFDVSKQQKQLQSVIQDHLDQSPHFGPFQVSVCKTVSHNVAFNNINH